MGAMAEMNGQPPPSEEEPMIILGGCGILIGMMIALVGAGLGVAGCMATGYKKGFAITGMILGGGFLVGMMMLMLIGLAMGNT